jgi:hypothetical protein
VNITGVTYSGMLAPPAPTREQIVRLQEAMWPARCAAPEALHHFAAGMYLREFSMPAGMLVVGKTHLHQHFMLLVKGEATVAGEHGLQRIRAPFITVSQPGAKRVVLAHEDCMFVTVHLNPTDTRDLLQIEAEHIAPETLGLPHAAPGELQ